MWRVAALFLLVLVALPARAEESSSVVVLSVADFDEKTSSGVWLVEFFAPWCGHCKNLAPIWAKLAVEAKSDDINVASVDCTVQQAVCTKLGVRGYPTIKLLRDGKLYDYSQPREVSQFLAFAKEGYRTATPKDLPQNKEEAKKDEPKREAPEEKKPESKPEAPATGETSQVSVLTTANFDDSVKEGTWLIKFYAPWCGHCKRLVPTWDSLATKAEGKFHVAKVDCTVDKELCSKHGVRGYPTIKLFKGTEISDYRGARTEEAFIQFALEGGASEAEKPQQPQPPVEKKEAPASGDSKVTVLTTANFAQSIANGAWLVKFYAPWCGHCKKLVPTWEELAQQSKGFNVAKVDCTVDKDLCSKFSVAGYPTIKLIKGDQVYDFKGARTLDAFTSFAADGYTSAPARPNPLATKTHDEL